MGEYELFCLEMDGDPYGAFAHENFHASAYDELGGLESHIVGRVNELTSPGMYEVDVAGPRALIVILTDIVSQYGGGQYVSEEDFCRWQRIMETPLLDEEYWSCQPWPQEEKPAWLESCRLDFDNLREVCKEHW